MNAAVESFVAGFPAFLIYTGAAGALLIAGCVLYIALTPQKELELLRAGNSSAGLALAGVIIGLAIPMASCLASSVSLTDLLIWGVVSLLIQILAFRFVDLLLRDLPRRIENDEAGAAILLIAVKLASALLISAALWDPNLSRLS
ncbi:MAG: hypothetical protein CME88_09330 [Hirschia sp.]|nr:hypothetical protein [Hirschia sp.]MBF18566.1 hypothetical protein [Hirschia sp.]|tara:strand:- start:247 stop:681 length:435 start_codon:yes stop_codon:yes gene_type:complete